MMSLALKQSSSLRIHPK